MRIAYVLYWNAYAADGVTRKVAAQVRAWRARGHEVEIYCQTPAGAGAPAIDGRLYPAASAAARIGATSRLARDVRAARPDVLYLRQDLWSPSVWWLVRRVRTVIEVNGYDYVPVAGLRRLVRMLRLFNYRVLIDGAAGLVVVTPTLADVFSHYGKPIAVVTNGIDLQAVEPSPPAHNERPRLVFVGSARQAWQGTDKLLRLAALAPEFDLDVVGITREELDGVPPNVTVHGWLDRGAYGRLLDAADVGVGPLALHRKRLEQAAALKVREYLAHGLPVVLTGEDGDFVGERPWFLLRLPNTEDTVERSVEAIRSFVADVKGRRVERSEIADRIDAGVKEQRRLDFFAELAR
jgi:glycosyltransferase involved in cell wall biosynthesis